MIDEYDNILKFSRKEMDHMCKRKVYRKRTQQLKNKSFKTPTNIILDCSEKNM